MLAGRKPKQNTEKYEFQSNGPGKQKMADLMKWNKI